MRDKAAKRRWRTVVRAASWAGALMAAVALASGGYWLYKDRTALRLAQSAADGAYVLTAKAGFVLRAIYLEGRNRTPLESLEKALGIRPGEPLLRLSLEEARARLEAIESIKTAAVERELPGTLYVRIVEREPVALWQQDGMLSPVDDNGVVMKDIDPAPYRRLPLIVGEEAPRHVASLLAMLASQPELAQRFAAAIYVGQRRWNIRLTNRVEIRLPESKAAEAWNTLAGLQAEQRLLDRDVKVIDLRVPGRLFIKVSPAEPATPGAGAKET